MHVVDAPFAGAANLLRVDSRVERAYRDVLDVLRTTHVPRQTKIKAKPEFVYDQTALQSSIRSQLRGLGWTHGRGLSEDALFDGIQVRGFQADMLGDELHVILDFGNRSSWAHNFLTRAIGAHARGWAKMTVVVTPVDAFARQIDTNLGAFERVAASLHTVERWRPEAFPGPMMLVGTSTDGS